MKKNLDLKAFSLIELSVVILIVGILIAGVTQGSRLIYQSRLSNARSQTNSSPVTVIEDIAFWFDAITEKSFEINGIIGEPEDGAEINIWVDTNPQVIDSNNAAALGDNGLPTYVAKCLNGLPCVRFDGVDDYFSVERNILFEELTFFVVFKPRILSVQTLIGSSEGDGSTGNDDSFSLTTLSDGRVFINFCGISHGPISTQMADNNKLQLFTATSQAIGETKIFKNGILDVEGAVANQVVSQTVNIGREQCVNGQFYDGDIAEIIAFDRKLRLNEIASINAYLMQKWRIRN